MQHFNRPGVWLGILAVVLAMSGSAYAASKITGAQIKDGTITSRDIKAGSIAASDLSFRPMTRVVTKTSQTVHLLPGQSTVDVVGAGNFSANCPTNTSVIGTGFDAGIGKIADVTSYESFVGGFVYNDTTVDFDVSLQAICGGTGSQPVAAVAQAARAKARARYTREQLARASDPVATISCKTATIGGAKKCIARGQFCAVRNQRDYKRYGFVCKKDNAGRYRLR